MVKDIKEAVKILNVYDTQYHIWSYDEWLVFSHTSLGMYLTYDEALEIANHLVNKTRIRPQLNDLSGGGCRPTQIGDYVVSSYYEGIRQVREIMYTNDARNRFNEDIAILDNHYMSTYKISMLRTIDSVICKNHIGEIFK